MIDLKYRSKTYAVVFRQLDTPENFGVFSGAALARKFGVFWRVHSTLQLTFRSGAAPENTPDNTPK